MAFIILALLAANTIAFWSAVMTPSMQWHAAGKSKGGWILLLLVVGIFAAVPYLCSVRPALQAARGRSAPMGNWPPPVR